MPFDRVTTFCFGASYAVALLIELLQLFRRRRGQQMVGLFFGLAGLLAHTIFLAVQWPSLASRFGSLLFLAWILAVFYMYGSLHHRQVAWGVFVLPVVLGLVILAALFSPGPGQMRGLDLLDALKGEGFWGLVHVSFLLLAAVGVCVGFMASVMYLLQAHRLRAKVPVGTGLKLLSLERLEEMNRRAINLAFPLLTIGALIGVALLTQRSDTVQSWTDPRIIGTIILWLVFVLLLYLRYGIHLRGRRLAQLTILAFILLVFTLAFSHSGQGGSP